MSHWIRFATPADVPVLHRFIRELAEFERLAHEVRATEADIHRSIFEEQNGVEALIVEQEGRAAGFAIFFKNYSTFLGRPGLYLEDLYVSPEFRGHGSGEKLMRHLAQICIDRNYGRFEWAVLDWNERAIKFYRSIGAKGVDGWTIQRMDRDAIHGLVAAN